MNRLKGIIEELFVDACLITLGVDMLYLYANNAWCEPTKVILFAELALFVFLPLYAVRRLYRYLKKEFIQ